jgi:hypothetical protein
MTTQPVKASPISALTLCGVSVVLLAIALWMEAQWWVACSAATSQEERVRYFLTHLPLGLGGLGAANLTWLSAAAATVGLVAAAVAARRLRGVGHVLSVGLAWANGLLAFWYLFTLM